MEKENYDIVEYIKRFPSSYNKHGGDDDDEDVMLPAEPTMNESSFNIKIVDDFIDIGEIRKREAVKHSPATNHAIDEKITRLGIINAHKDIKLLKLIAGASGLALEDLFDSSELDRAHDTMLVEQSNRKRANTEIAHSRKERDILQRELESARKEVAFLNTNSYSQFSKEVKAIAPNMEAYMKLLRLKRDYTLILNDGGSGGEYEKKQLVRFLLQYYRDYGLVTEAETLKRGGGIEKESIETLRNASVFALFVRDNMDLDRHSHDDKRGVSLIQSIQNKNKQLTGGAGGGGGGGRQEELGDVIKVKIEGDNKDKVYKEDANKKLIEDEVESSYQLIMYSNLFKDDILERIIHVGIEKSIARNGSDIVTLETGMSYKIWMTRMIKTLDVTNEVQANNMREALMEQLRGKERSDTLLKMHNAVLNSMLDKIKGSDTKDIIERCKSYFMWVFFTHTGVLKIYNENKKEIDKHLDNIKKKHLVLTHDVLTQTLRYHKEDAIEHIDENLTETLRANNIAHVRPPFINADQINIRERSIRPTDVIIDDSLREYFLRIVKVGDDDDVEEHDYKLLMSLINETTQNDVLLLEWYKFFIDYVAYCDRYREEKNRLISTKRHLLERLVEDLDEEQAILQNGRTKRLRKETSSSSSTSLLENGIFLLAPGVMAEIERARKMVQRFCPAFKNATLEDMQSREAIECGFTGEFASLVSAVGAQSGLIRPRSYSPKHMVARVKEEIAALCIHLREYAYNNGRISAKPVNTLSRFYY